MILSSFKVMCVRVFPQRHFRRRSVHAILFFFLSLCALSAFAQNNYEIQTYGADVVEPGHTMVELHSNFTIQGFKTVVDGVYPDNHAEHETIEITHGFTPWFECGFYIFTSERSGQGVDWVGDHIRPRFAVPDEWHWPVGVSISNEIGYQRRVYSTDTWTWELRPIMDKKLGRWYLAFNPAMELSLHGENKGRGMEFSPNFKVSYDITPKVAFGAEYYGSLGPITGFDPLSQQQHQLFPAFDLNLAPQWEVNFGLGWGFTPTTEHLLAKMIIGYRFNF